MSKPKWVWAVVILVTIVSAVVLWTFLSRPTRPILSEQEVRQLITEYPTIGHFEVKPETIEFLSLELVPIEESPLAEDINKRESPDKVWVVKYECEGRIIPIPSMTPRTLPPFTRHFVQVIINAYTGIGIRYHAKDVNSFTLQNYPLVLPKI
jgi:hypothetical protein